MKYGGKKKEEQEQTDEVYTIPKKHRSRVLRILSKKTHRSRSRKVRKCNFSVDASFFDEESSSDSSCESTDDSDFPSPKSPVDYEETYKKLRKIVKRGPPEGLDKNDAIEEL